jgi:hypothetical protein
MAVEKFKQICEYSEWEYIVTRLGKFLERNGIEYHGGTHIE